MANQFLDKDGLDKVAEKVNTRLKTVTEMPLTANNGAVRLYVGDTVAGSYTKGHTYQYRDDTYLCFKWDLGQIDPQYAGNYYYLYLKSGTTLIYLNTGSETNWLVPAANSDDFIIAPNTEYVSYEGSVLTIRGASSGDTFVCNADPDNNLEGGAWVDITPAGGAVSADDVSYANAQIPSASNVESALDTIISKIYYVEPKVDSFTMAPSTTDYEIGQSVSDIVFNWTYNKDVVSQTLTDCALADATVRTATAAGPYTATKTFTLSASDGEKTATATKTISFRHKVYWGSAASAATYDSAFILALSGKKFATNYKGTYSMNVATGEYGFLAYPNSWGMVSSWYIGGFETETFDCGTVEFTNASGNTTTFRIVRTTQPGLGEIAPEVR